MTKGNKSIPTISIIMPTYNRAGLIIETIESIQRQTYSDWELIIVDDGSTDETEEKIRQFADERIQFIKAGRIGIGGRIKNIGIQHSSGTFIAFSDSDDPWEPTKLEKQVNALERYPGAGFCLTGGFMFEKIDQPQKYFYKQKEGEKFADILIPLFNSGIAGYVQALMLRRECLATAGHFREVKSFSDLDFIASLASHFKAVILYEPLVYRRLHESNYITNNWAKSYDEGIALIREYRPRLPVAISRNAFFRIYINYGEKSLLYKKRWQAVTKFLKAWQYKPFSTVPMKKMLKAFVWYLHGK